MLVNKIDLIERKKPLLDKQVKRKEVTTGEMKWKEMQGTESYDKKKRKAEKKKEKSERK